MDWVVMILRHYESESTRGYPTPRYIHLSPGVLYSESACVSAFSLVEPHLFSLVSSRLPRGIFPADVAEIKSPLIRLVICNTTSDDATTEGEPTASKLNKAD